VNKITPQTLCRCGDPMYLHHYVDPSPCMKSDCSCTSFNPAASNFEDVVEFHRKFSVPIGEFPQLLTKEDYDFRLGFMYEELEEFEKAHESGDLAGAADALIDLVYVALGCAAWMGLPWQELWNDVQRANMSKVAQAVANDANARHKFDVRKPEGWVPPKGKEIILAALIRAGK